MTNIDTPELNALRATYEKEIALEYEVDQSLEETEKIETDVKNDKGKQGTAHETHRKAVDEVSRNLIEHGIETRYGPGKGIDIVIVNNGNTIKVCGADIKNGAIPLVQVKTNNLSATHVIVVGGLRNHKKLFYIMNRYTALNISDEKYYKKTGNASWFIRFGDYKYYQDDYNVLNINGK